ncbi:MAG: hypothetical protein H7230_03820 [Candidatus Parcubacteria bacterium]|nr:hypothetical protein [Candidatus Paceibacterota bacterium]
MSIEYRPKIGAENPALRETNQKYIALQIETFAQIQAIAALNINEVEDNATTSLFSRFNSIYYNIIELNKLVRQLKQIKQDSTQTLDSYTKQNGFFLDWVEVLGGRQGMLLKNNSPFETIQLAMLRIKVGVELNLKNFLEVRTALSIIVDQSGELVEPIPARLMRYILAFEKGELAELGDSNPGATLSRKKFYEELRARVDHAPGQ